MHQSLNFTSHRPWPVPGRTWTWRQSWCDLLFAHWPVSKKILLPHVPEKLCIQEFDGTSWIAVVPFRMEGVMRRPFPDLPYISAFPELNVRVYVEYQGKPGVYFFSLDATNPFAVWAARKFFHLPYYRAKINIANESQNFQYNSRRIDRRGTPAELDVKYRPISNVYHAKKGTLEHFLTERYCLYADLPDGTLTRTEVHHIPWPLQKAEAEVKKNTMTDSFGIHFKEQPALLHFAQNIDVAVWSPEICI